MRSIKGKRSERDNDLILAVGLLTANDLRALGPEFKRAYPVDETPCFGELLRAIDEADRRLRHDRMLSDNDESVQSAS